jgi:TolB-like protein/Flp pilus assembly protein TadD
VDFQFADCEIDLRLHELRRAGTPVHLEPQVFNLLVHLIRNRDRVVSKDELIAVVWNGRNVSEASLSSRVAAARRALGDSGNSQRVIRTFHKRGFRFVVEVGERACPIATFANRSSPAAEALREPVQLGDKPSIAVLPFDNMSADPEQDYFADGLTEDIITSLSRQRWFSVIARNSTFTFKGQTVDVRDVAAQLGVRYVLEGSVRRADNRVRITAQLIDAVSGNHLWAEKYDRELADIFAVQDEITTRINGSVAPQIVLAETARLRRMPPRNIDAWDLVMRALPHMWRMNAEEHARAQDLLVAAIACEPDYAHAHALLGWTHITSFNLDTRRPIRESTEQALASGARAVLLDEEDPWGHLVLGLGHARRRHPELALRHLGRALELSPSFALAHAGLGYALACGGQPERGLAALEEALRLSPQDPFLAIYAPVARYMALFALGRYEETIALCRSTIALHPNHAGAWRLMTVSLGLLDRLDEAREALAHTLTLQPDLSSAHVANDTVYADPDDRARFLEGLRKAGLRD